MITYVIISVCVYIYIYIYVYIQGEKGWHRTHASWGEKNERAPGEKDKW